jgi:hypothetical protein
MAAGGWLLGPSWVHACAAAGCLVEEVWLTLTLLLLLLLLLGCCSLPIFC